MKVENATDTLMYQEALEAADVVNTQLSANASLIEEIVDVLKKSPPCTIMTCARGSSDHATLFGKYLFESKLDIATVCAAPSVHSVFGGKPNLEGGLFIGVSQSGASPDLVRAAEGAKATGARVIAMVNVTDSPLAATADHIIPLHAGPEKSVAATKTFIASIVALTHLVCVWSGDEALQKGLTGLPDQLRQAAKQDWSPALDVLLQARNFFVTGRGTGFAIAREAALKFKETCGLHAEAYSAAEIKHGPMAIIDKGFPVLAFTQNDESRAGLDDLLPGFARRGAIVMTAGKAFADTITLPTASIQHPVLETIGFIQSFYIMVNALSVARGYNPDVPPHLNKVTETL